MTIPKTLTLAIIAYFIDYFHWLKNAIEDKQKVSMIHLSLNISGFTKMKIVFTKENCKNHLWWERESGNCYNFNINITDMIPGVNNISRKVSTVSANGAGTV